jgi:hypothetical protein
MRLLWSMAASAALFAANAFASPPTRIEDATLVGISGAWPVAAGVVLTLVRLELEHAGARTEVFAVQLRPGEAMPPVGATCTIDASYRRVDGRTADGRTVRGEVLFADHIACGGREYLSDG